mgnify:CR=1 FL=1|tara:strand:- start:43 stop:219 length:177 start_codon:yes stop_codon:yes gene_type:complete
MNLETTDPREQIELSLYSRLLEDIVSKMKNYEDMKPNKKLELVVLVGKIKELDNKYIA